MPWIDSTQGASGAAGAAGAAQQQPATGLGDLDSEAFLHLLVAQMRYQDPMAPADHTAMLQQTSQFTQVEALQRVSEVQQQLLGLSQAGIAADLVGKEVAAERPDGTEVTGVVEAVRFGQSGPLLQIGDEEVPLQAATQIGLPSTPLAGAGPGLGATLSSDPGATEQWSGPWFHDSEDTNA